MINVFYFVKKWGAFALCVMLPAYALYTMTVFRQPFMVSMGVYLLIGLMCVIISNTLIKNPFTDMLEGKGLLSINFDSTGIMRPFISEFRSPYIVANSNNKSIKDAYDRNIAIQLSLPVKTKHAWQRIEDSEKNIRGWGLFIDDDEFSKSKFVLNQYNVLLWNDQLQTFITKEALGTFESNVLANHIILALKRFIDDLTSNIRNFARHFVDLTKPEDKKNIFANPVAIVIMVIAVIGVAILIIMNMPKITASLQGMFGGK
jgi:hypothetical protein